MRKRGIARCATASSVSDARRGDVWLIDLGEPLGHEQGWRRPGLVVSSDGWNRHASTCTVVPLTRTRHGLPTRVEVEPSGADGLQDTSYARCEDVRSISEERLVHRLGAVDGVTLARIATTLRIFLEV